MTTTDGFLMCDWCQAAMADHGVLVGGKEICAACAVRAEMVEAFVLRVAAVLRGVVSDSTGSMHRLQIDVADALREVVADIDREVDQEPTLDLVIGGGR